MYSQRNVSKFPEINILRNALIELNVGQSGLVSFVNKPVMDRAFFPGGNGLYLGEEAERFPAQGILVLGSNFGAIQNFIDDREQLVSRDETESPGTWHGLKKRLLEEQLRNAFFTNAWPFLHVGESNNPSDKDRWLRDDILMRSCREFFDVTMATVMPKVVVAIGSASAAFLGTHYKGDIACWKTCRFKDGIDRQPFTKRVIDNCTVMLVAITHPSMSNAHNRSQPFNTANLERELLQSVLKTV